MEANQKVKDKEFEIKHHSSLKPKPLNQQQLRPSHHGKMLLDSNSNSDSDTSSIEKVFENTEVKSTKQSNLKALSDVIYKCHKETCQTASILNQFDSERTFNALLVEKHKKVQQSLHDLQGSDPHTLKKLFTFTDQTMQREKRESREAVMEYKRESLDPHRRVVGWEIKGNQRKRLKL